MPTVFVCDRTNTRKNMWRLCTKQVLIISVIVCSAWPSPVNVFQQHIVWKRMIPELGFFAMYEMYGYLSVRGFLMLLWWVQVRMWEDEEASEIMTSSCSMTYLSLLWRILGKDKVSATLRVFGWNFSRRGSPFHYRNCHLWGFCC